MDGSYGLFVGLSSGAERGEAGGMIEELGEERLAVFAVFRIVEEEEVRSAGRAVSSGRFWDS